MGLILRFFLAPSPPVWRLDRLTPPWAWRINARPLTVGLTLRGPRSNNCTAEFVLELGGGRTGPAATRVKLGGCRRTGAGRTGQYIDG